MQQNSVVFGISSGRELSNHRRFDGRNLIWPFWVFCSSAPDQPGADGWHTKAKVGKYLQASGLPYTQVYPCCYYDVSFKKSIVHHL